MDWLGSTDPILDRFVVSYRRPSRYLGHQITG